MTVGGLGSVMKLMFAGILFLLLVKFSFGRKLLTKVSIQSAKELKNQVVGVFLFPLIYCLFFNCFSFPSHYAVPRIFLCWTFHKERTNPETGNWLLSIPPNKKFVVMVQL